MQIRKSDERGSGTHSWLQTKYTFSFADYVDPAHMGFHSLRVINEDLISPDKGFGMHSHDNMEIITYILDGELAHKDSMGNGSTIRAGDVQRMSAGSGIRHSEFNPSKNTPVHLLQIWLLPAKRDIEPSYQEMNFSWEKKRGKLCLLASKQGEEGSLSINQDVNLFAGLLNGSEIITYTLPKGRAAWIQVVRGSLTLNDQPLSTGDAAALEGEHTLTFKGGHDAEFLLFDMAQTK